MAEFSPRHIRDVRVACLSDSAFRALMNLVFFTGSGLVWTYTPPGDGSFPDDDDAISRLASLGSVRRWKRVRPEVEQFFVIRGGRWHLNEPWIEILGSGRPAIPGDIQAEVRRREGSRCTYCGATDRRLEFDHIFPVSRGGSDEPSNLALACDRCNRSKGAKTIQEWINGRR
jgi:hypothetical protein